MNLLNPTENVLPNNPEAEQSVIGSCLVTGDTSTFDLVSPIVTADDFYNVRYRFLFEAVHRLAEDNKPLDEIHLCEALKGSNRLDEVGGMAGLMSLANAATTQAQAVHYAKLISEKANLRKLIRHCRVAEEQARDESESFNDIRATLESGVLEIDSKDTSGYGVQDSVDELVNDLKLMQAGEYAPDVVQTNVGRLDLFLGNRGIAAGEVLTLAAPTSCGKSAFALYVSLKAMTEQNVSTAYFSFEMPQKQLMKRMVQALSGVNLRNIQEGTANADQAERFYKASERIKELPLYTVHAVKGVEDLISQARYLVRKKGVKLIVVDYLQLIGFNSKSMSKAEGIAHISHRIKQMALDLNVSVILLAQVNREGAKRETGLSLYDLKDSGDIENDADVVLLMWPHKGDVESSKDSDYRGSFTGLSYKLAKNREGERDIGDYLRFYHCTGRFE